MEQNIIPCTDGDDEFIAEQLNAVTDSMIDFDDAAEDELVVFKVTDGDGSIIAGCNLLIDCWRAAELDILWVDEEYRGRGLGSALLRAAERAAMERGCRLITLGTFDFQARPLYEKNGYAVCGVLEDCPTPGHTHYDMIKQLDGLFAEAESATASACDIRSGSEEDAEFIDDSLCEYNWSQVPSSTNSNPSVKRSSTGTASSSPAAGPESTSGTSPSSACCGWTRPAAAGAWARTSCPRWSGKRRRWAPASSCSTPGSGTWISSKSWATRYTASSKTIPAGTASTSCRNACKRRRIV